MAEHDISMAVNGTDEQLTVESRTLLVHALRDDLGYTGPKVGCERSSCGACTIHLEGEAVKSCTVLAVQADGSSVTTVEGLEGRSEGGDTGESGHRLHPVQEHFHAEHGLQCGYCTPGMVMTTTQVLAENPAPTRAEIRTALKGNRCRCTGYQNIVDAVESAARALGDDISVLESSSSSGSETDSGTEPAPDGGQVESASDATPADDAEGE